MDKRRFNEKLYLNKHRRDGLAINDLLKLPVNLYWKNKYGFYLGCNDAKAQVALFNTRNDIIGMTLNDFARNASLITETDNFILGTGCTKYIIEVADAKNADQYLANNLYKIFVSIKQPLYDNNNNIIGMFGVSFNFERLMFIDWKHLLGYFAENWLEQIQTEIRNYILSRASCFLALTKREKQCMFYLSRGRSLKEIALLLRISPKTVESYWENVKVKLNCSAKSGVIDRYLEYKLIEEYMSMSHY